MFIFNINIDNIFIHIIIIIIIIIIISSIIIIMRPAPIGRRSEQLGVICED